MGSTTSQTLNSNQTVINNVLQQSETNCSFQCIDSISGQTIIVIGGSGDINVTQECSMKGLSCIMSQSFNSQVQNILTSMLQQNSSATSGFALTWTDVNQTIDMTQYIQSSITQTMNSTCTFVTDQSATGNYYYVQDRNGDLNISQSSTIENSNCNMNVYASNVTYNDASASASQSSKITSIFSIIAIIFIVAIIMGGIVVIVFIISGGVAKSSSNKSSTTTPASTSSSSTTNFYDQAANLYIQNPDAFNQFVADLASL